MRNQDAVSDTTRRGVEDCYLIRGGAGDEGSFAIRRGDERRGGKVFWWREGGGACLPESEERDAESQDCRVVRDA